MTPAIAAPENEFADVADRAATLGVAPPSRVNRKWVNVSTGGHVSAVVWGSGPEIVLVHRPGDDARSLDARSLDDVALLLGCPAAVLDLPGSGRSNGPATRPRRAGVLLAEAVSSFAPGASLVAGIGEGGLAALAALARLRGRGGLVLVDALPGLGDQPDDRLAWEQLAGVADVELVRSSDGPVTAEQAARFGQTRRGAVVTDLPFVAKEIESAAAPELAGVLLGAAKRAGAA